MRPDRPAEAYRRVEREACIAGSDSGGLVRLCLEEVISALGQAIWADRSARPHLRSRSLMRAQSGLLALKLGVDRESPISTSLFTLYDAALDAIVTAQRRFDPVIMEKVRADMSDIRAAFAEIAFATR